MNLKAELTKRETEVAELLAFGAAKKQVAGKLGISVHTVGQTARNIYDKIEVQSIGALSSWWHIVKGRSIAAQPFLSALLLLVLICVNEYSDDESKMIRTSRAKSTRVSKTRKRHEYDDDTIDFI
ncbi:helix-turn-helix transcriptional regulator [Niabella insulamsoli]|uniref:helix-turn-helix transcriptional regulator n=1 Tax=Niabella insulamsoli TaxID=3144874 RepID=UPI0031FCAD54